MIFHYLKKRKDCKNKPKDDALKKKESLGSKTIRKMEKADKALDDAEKKKENRLEKKRARSNKSNKKNKDPRPFLTRKADGKGFAYGIAFTGFVFYLCYLILGVFLSTTYSFKGVIKVFNNSGIVNVKYDIETIDIRNIEGSPRKGKSIYVSIPVKKTPAASISKKAFKKGEYIKGKITSINDTSIEVDYPLPSSFPIRNLKNLGNDITFEDDRAISLEFRFRKSKVLGLVGSSQ